MKVSVKVKSLAGFGWKVLPRNSASGVSASLPKPSKAALFLIVWRIQGVHSCTTYVLHPCTHHTGECADVQKRRDGVITLSALCGYGGGKYDLVKGNIGGACRVARLSSLRWVD